MSAGTTISFQFHSGASDVAQPVTHSALNFFDKPSVVINHEGSHDQEDFPQVVCREPQLDFIITSDNRNLVDLSKITWQSTVPSIKPMQNRPPKKCFLYALEKIRYIAHFLTSRFLLTAYWFHRATMHTTTQHSSRRR